MEVLQYPLALIVTLGILVTIHELGHYLVARLSGVTITRFAVGFGRPLWARMDARGTEWVIAAIPLGGYVRMLDERELPRGDSVPAGSLAFNQLTPAWRIAIAAAGPAANFVLALVVYWILSIMGSVNAAPLLGPLQPEDAIAQAGGQVGEEIRAVDGVQTRSWQQVSVALAARLGESGAIELELRRPGSTRSRTIDVPIQDWHQGESDPPLLESLGINPLLPPMIGQVVGDSPAAAAGLRVGDLPLTVEAEAVPSWRSFVAAIQARPGKRLSLTVDRDGRQVALTVVPESRTAEGATEPSGYLGVGPPMNELTFGPLAAVGNAIDETIAKTGLTLGLLKKMVVGQVSVQNLSGPITIAEVAGNSARLGLNYFLGVLALLSISLGIMNLLPIPILDGGHIIWAAAEWVRGRPVPDQVQVLGAQFGLLAVGSLMIIALYNDVARLLQ